MPASPTGRRPTISVPFTLGASGSYFTKFDQDFGDEVFSVLNTSGYNTTFPEHPAQGAARSDGKKDPVSLDLFLNYIGSYRNYSNTSVTPVLTTPSGNPPVVGDKVDSNKTLDLHIAYDFTGDFLNGSQIYVDVNNLTDQKPPFYNGNTSGIGVGGWGYNAFVSNPIGRVTSIGFRRDLIAAARSRAFREFPLNGGVWPHAAVFSIARTPLATGESLSGCVAWRRAIGA